MPTKDTYDTDPDMSNPPILDDLDVLFDPTSGPISPVITAEEIIEKIDTLEGNLGDGLILLKKAPFIYELHGWERLLKGDLFKIFLARYRLDPQIIVARKVVRILDQSGINNGSMRIQFIKFQNELQLRILTNDSTGHQVTIISPILANIQKNDDNKFVEKFIHGIFHALTSGLAQISDEELGLAN